jgi:8-oxo-dGTP diphosphatase
MRRVHVVAAVIRRTTGQGRREVLLARRPEHLHQGGLWEFSGGKVEPGEEIQQALARELDEELGITPLGSPVPLIRVAHDYADKHVLLDVWIVDQFDGEPFGREGQLVRWVDVERLDTFAFPAANAPIVRACRMPRYHAITPEYPDLQTALTDFAGRSKPDWLLLRQPRLAPTELLDWLAAYRASPLLAQTQILLSGDPALLGRPDCAGFQLPFAVAQRYRQRPVGVDCWLGVSCHTPDEVAHAERIGADFVTVSPVLPTPSHPERKPLGWDAFRQIVACARIPVFALGGVDRRHFELALDAGAQGVAGIRWW